VWGAGEFSYEIDGQLGIIEKERNNNGETRRKWKRETVTVIKIRKKQITNIHRKLHWCPLLLSISKHKYMGICVEVKRHWLLK
jgi:uncharacterized membrane protein YcaP (DUF421 family)